MNINQLEYLLDINNTYSISNTAKRFFVTQQAMSNSIKQLENELGYTLLKRSKKGITFTDEGKIFLEYAEKILANFQEMQSSMLATSTHESNDNRKRIYIFNSSVIGYLINASLLSISRKNFPQISMRLFFNENNSYNVIEKLLKKECDICLITMNASALSARASLFAENNIVCEILAEDFIVSCFNNLSKYASNDMTFPNNHCIIHLSELEKYNNYFYDDSATSIMRFDDILSVRDILKKNTDVVAFMPNTTYRNYFSTSKYISRTIPEIILNHALLYRENCDHTTSQFIKIIKDETLKIL